MRWSPDCVAFFTGRPVASLLANVTKPGSERTKAEQESFLRSLAQRLHPQARPPAEIFWLTAALAITVGAFLVLPSTHRIIGTVFGWALFLLAWIDLKRGRLPDQITVPLAYSGLAVAAVVQSHSLAHHVLGLVLGFGFFWVIARIYRQWRDRDGLGGGDVKLLAAAGAWVGWEGLPLVLLISSISALLFVSWRGRFAPADRIRFGPFLAFASWLVWACIINGARLS